MFKERACYSERIEINNFLWDVNMAGSSKLAGDWVLELLTGLDKPKEPKIRALCKENGAELEPEYINTGLLSMDAGKILRAIARHRHGLTVNGKFMPIS